MSIKSRGRQQTIDGYMSQYVPPTSETPDTGGYPDMNTAPQFPDHKIYDGNFNVDPSTNMEDAYVYNYGTPISPHERWSDVAHRSASLAAMSGVRSSVDIISSQKGQVNHEVESLKTTTHLPGYA